MEKTPNLDNVAKRAAYLVDEFTKTAGLFSVIDNTVRNPMLLAYTALGSLSAGHALGNRFPVDTPDIDMTHPSYTALEQAVMHADSMAQAHQAPDNIEDIKCKARDFYRASIRTNVHKPSAYAAMATGGVLGSAASALMNKRSMTKTLASALLGAAVGNFGHAVSAARRKNNPFTAPAMVTLERILKEYPSVE